jgi:regulator of RNase E activity RraA
VSATVIVPDLVQRLRELDTCAVSDAMDALGLAGVADGLRPLWEGAELAGRVVTVAVREVSAGAAKVSAGPAKAPRHLGAGAIEAAEPGDVIVLDNEGRVGMGSWGGLLTAAAAEHGIAGVVVDGACRDVDEIRASRFPVFARGGAMRTARGRVGEATWGEAVGIAGVEVQRGDFVRADGSGVVFVPASDIERVLQVAERLAAKEKLMLADLRAGRSPSAVLAGNYETMLTDETVR